MSRCEHLPLPTKEEEAEQAEYINSLRLINGVVHTLSKELIVREQKTDDTLNTVRGWVIDGPPAKEELKGQSEEIRSYFQILGCLKLEDDVLFMTKSMNNLRQEKMCAECVSQKA